ncbi:MAG: PEP/pyruvate-binding domain-containing protein, partial [Pseudomonadota bacterium]
LRKFFRNCYEYWIGQVDPMAWFVKEAGNTLNCSKELGEIFQPISHKQLHIYKGGLKSRPTAANRTSKESLSALLQLPGFRQIVNSYEEIPRQLFQIGEKQGEGNHWKLLFLFHIMNMSGLSAIHEEVLRDINRTSTWLIGNENTREIQQTIQKTFAILSSSFRTYHGTALNCILNMGKAVYKTDDSELVGFFMGAVVNLGFHAPELKRVGDDGQIRANEAHISNIRTWLELIEQNPKWSKKLLSSLIIHLSLSGVIIKDTDLFPRDITRLLNSDIGEVYNLVKQLLRLFPTYFNEIGAEGVLRDVSTRLDEISLRKDVLIHFLRKQSHVESSNQIVGLIEAVLEFWKTRDKTPLKNFVPENLYGQIESDGPHIRGVHSLMNHLLKAKGLDRISDLLKIEDNTPFSEVAGGEPGSSGADIERLELALSLYKMLYHKYHLSSMALHQTLSQVRSGAFPESDKLQATLSLSDPRQKLSRLISYLEKLKEIILSPESYEIREDIYHKRHFAVDIPSMYGSYHEKKFDALGLSFRLESLVNILFEEIIEKIDLKLITRASFTKIYDALLLFHRALKLDGIPSSQIERQLELLAQALKVRDFSFTQFLDIFRGFLLAVRNIVNDYFNNIHQQNLRKILNRILPEDLLPKYRSRGVPMDDEKLTLRVSEMFLRERIATSLSLQQLDLFLSRILTTLFDQSDKLPAKGLRLLLNYDPQKSLTPLDRVKKGVSDIIYLGNKGLNLVRLTRYGFPVPPGFIITTEVFRYHELIENYPPANNNLKEQVAMEISALEKLTGQTFGCTKNPLLLSVRSGSAISQPGMMDTFLDVGINEDIVHGIISLTGNEWFAWDCFRRFLQSYGMAFGLSRDAFDDIIASFKKRLDVPFKSHFTGEQMRQVALTYRDFIRDHGTEIEDSPFEQLYMAIKKVLDSWDSKKAKTYRNIMRISDDWGTAVTVQKMVFGNISRQSGSGVVFTHSPKWSGDTLWLWGDFTLGNQGEDVVSGLVKTLPVSKRQAEAENRDEGIILETHFPEIYDKIRTLAKILIYERKWGPQEMEFTFENPAGKGLFFLQTRDMAIREIEKVQAFVSGKETEKRLIGHGIGVSGGAMAGRAVFSLEEIREWRSREPVTYLILIRGDTVPDDIMEIYEADGLLTARGGSTSHAAIVAHRLGKTCVVGCAYLICMEKERHCNIHQHLIKSGDWIGIEGQTGSIYFGKLEIKETEGV